MANRGVNVVVFDDKAEVLLQKRRDFRIWGLPGGHIEPGESWEEAGVRETFEETGYRIEVCRQVGEYSRPQMPRGGAVVMVCLGRVVGGEPIEEGPETIEVGWFPVKALPSSLLSLHRECILDAMADTSAPLRKTQRIPILQGLLIRTLLRLRDAYNRVFRER